MKPSWTANEMPAASRSSRAQEEFRPQSKLFQAPPSRSQQHRSRLSSSLLPQPAPCSASRQRCSRRMPKVEDFPPIVKAEPTPVPSLPAEERGPMGLLKRITRIRSVAATRKTGQRHRRPPVSRGACLRPERRPPSPEAASMRRAGQLDDQGRAVLAARACRKTISSKSRRSCAASRTDLIPAPSIAVPGMNCPRAAFFNANYQGFGPFSGLCVTKRKKQ